MARQWTRPRSPATGHLPGHHQAAGQLTARATPLRGLRGPGQRWGCSHAVIKDHPPRRYRRLEQPPCSGGPAHKDPDRAGTRNPRDYRVPRSRIHPAGRWRGRPRLRFGYRFGRDPRRYPRLFTASNVLLTTWLRHPAAGLDSYRRHLWALREYEAGPQPEDPIDKLREWSARYGMVNPDDLNLPWGGRL
jgi:hypothetical protein